MEKGLICEEMVILRRYLDEHKVKWKDISEEIRDDNGDIVWWMCRTHFIVKKELFSVINGYGSYGGFNLVTEKNSGLLELMINNRNPEGYLIAEDIIKKIERI